MDTKKNIIVSNRKIHPEIKKLLLGVDLLSDMVLFVSIFEAGVRVTEGCSTFDAAAVFSIVPGILLCCGGESCTVTGVFFSIGVG